MLASRVHSVIAAALEHPELLALWRREPKQLRKCGVEPAELDLDALWKFAGLTVKVRHNGLRIDLPLTFRLLNLAGLEIEIFASYASFVASQGRRYADTPAGRAEDLLSFLEQWLDFDRRGHAFLWDLIRYELALNKLGRPLEAGTTRPTREQSRSLSMCQARTASVPRVVGEIILHEMSCDPRLLGAMLQEKSPRLETIPVDIFHFCYWRRDKTAEIHILETDELAFYLLSFADGERSAGQLSRLLGGGKKPSRGFLKALSELAALGIIALDIAPEHSL